jgi:hypothetical protein
VTVGELEKRLGRYPANAKVLMFRPPLRVGVDIEEDIIATFIRPDFESIPSSILLVPKVLTPKGKG